MLNEFQTKYKINLYLETVVLLRIYLKTIGTKTMKKNAVLYHLFFHL